MSELVDRWRRVERVCQDVLDRPRAERAAFLDVACGADTSLRHEVEALLEHEAASSAFLEGPAGAVAAAALPPSTRPLSGQRVGVFDIGPLLGVGGMGEVYRARDTNLHRDVALKVLPSHVAADAGRLARFAREARALGALNHPNIGAIYGFEKTGDIPALVLELVEGPTLEDRIARGPIPFDDARHIALQIAEALEAAHERGLVHRDLKPANIKIRADGVVKVLDFGLAKALEPALTTEDVPVATTVASSSMTRAGVLLGTPGYMSPEQAKGRPTGTRTDVWAFGAVLFEMLSGERAFKGDEWADALAAVLRSDPDWGVLPADTPEAFRRLLRRCLQKDPKQRLQHIGDARLELNDVEAIVRRTSGGSGAATHLAVRGCDSRRGHGVRRDGLDAGTAVVGGPAEAVLDSGGSDEKRSGALSRWTNARVRGGWRAARARRATTGRSEYRSDPGWGRRDRAVLLAGWRVDRVLRGWEAQEGAGHRWAGRDDL